MNFNKFVNTILESNQPTKHVDHNGVEQWILNGRLHRTDGPAVTRPSGTTEWWENGQRHREGGPAILNADGTEDWWINGKRHRDNGPAIIHKSGNKIIGMEWWRNGLLHRIDGPAYICFSRGEIFWEEWWVDGKQLTGDKLQEYKTKLNLKKTLAQKDDNLFNKNFIEELD